MDAGDITAVVIAATGLAGVWLSHRLGLLGQRKDAEQQKAAHRLAERVEYFDELESINDRLTAENTRLRAEVESLRTLISEAEARGDIRLAQQATRCRERLDDLIATVSTLQGVVVAEMAKTQAGDAIEKAMRHVAADHPEDED